MSHDDPTSRESIADATTAVYKALFPIIKAEVDGLLKKLLQGKAQESLKASLRSLEGIVDGLQDEGYLKEELSGVVGDTAADIDHALRRLYYAFMLEYSIDPVKLMQQSLARRGIPVKDQDVTILQLNRYFHDEMEKRAGHKIDVLYSEIAPIVRFLRNGEEHIKPTDTTPIDFITGKLSHGNIYTLCGTIILSLHAYREIIGLWVEI